MLTRCHLGHQWSLSISFENSLSYTSFVLHFRFVVVIVLFRLYLSTPHLVSCATCLAFHVHNINKPGPSSLLLRPSFLFVNIFIYIFFSFFTAAYSFVVVCRPIREENFLGFFGIACCRQKFVERKTVGGDGHVELVVVRMIFGPLPGRKQNGPVSLKLFSRLLNN